MTKSLRHTSTNLSVKKFIKEIAETQSLIIYQRTSVVDHTLASEYNIATVKL